MRISLVITFAAAFAPAASAQTPPPPNPDKPVDYAAWLNEQFAVPDARNAAAKYRQAVEALAPEPIDDNFKFYAYLKPSGTTTIGPRRLSGSGATRRR